MFFSNIHANENIDKKYPKPIAKAIQYLKNKQDEFIHMEPDIYPIEGEDIFVQVFDRKTMVKEEAKPEVHRKYIEVHYSVEGKERVGFAVDLGNNPVIETLLETKDAIYYGEVENEHEVIFQPGDYFVFFPEDVHRPIWEYGGSTMIRRVVIKIKESVM
ncbi:YhcH/YjgK/YiaL family protein [Bacillus sp. AFS077874]|uniref:YhcH/YjgK/YiaL family protein n=1 Tax=unclassified Bacillus (in: firmicutes) TaxID=185979 RepID=UPI000BEE5F15|nr:MULTISPECIES: YhcH/YjgK/YiaL family protein [unclassified Bacillus (in: firmicutes)]PEC50983.1 YhcH/YjgK/YiaL family protein [Bacillus sp. AFS096315]PET76360.1 YhcH/YjgK/YiaL family protein [Bacillus sp. AFS001701]PFM83225.1 YhcH/YjgK/YiaL family protein [Bacillus sp. AFS077874]